MFLFSDLNLILNPRMWSQSLCVYIKALVPLPLGWWPPKPHAPNLSIRPRATRPHPPHRHAYLKTGSENQSQLKQKTLSKSVRNASPCSFACSILFFTSRAISGHMISVRAFRRSWKTNTHKYNTNRIESM